MFFVKKTKTTFKKKTNFKNKNKICTRTYVCMHDKTSFLPPMIEFVVFI